MADEYEIICIDECHFRRDADKRRCWSPVGETQKVNFMIRPNDLQMLDKDLRKIVEPGEFAIMIGSSSEDIRLEGKIVIN